MNYTNKKSLLEQYQEKLKQRETTPDTYFLDQFSNNNLGKTQNISNNQLTIQQNQIYNNNLNNNNNIYNKTLNKKKTPNIKTNNNIINNNINNAYARPISQRQLKNIISNNENIGDPFGNNYKGTGIIPRDKGNNLKQDKYNQNLMLREIWAVEMREKKEREEKEKQRQKELDILEEERIKREIKEQEEKEKQEKITKKQNEEKILQDNVQLLQNKKNNSNLKENQYKNGNGNIDFYQYNNINNDQTINNNSNINVNNNNIDLYYNKNDFYTNQLKYKNIDLNNIHFYRSPNNNKSNNMNQNVSNRNKIRNIHIYNNRKVNEFEFSPNPRQLEDSHNPQISKLKKEVNTGYMEISSLFKQLKNNVIEANQNRNKAENHFKLITDEINKEKKYHLELERKKYEQMRPEEIYNSYYVNVRDVDPIYYTKNEKKLEENNMSNLAKMGQNLIRLTAESEFIPIGSNTYENNNLVIEENQGYDDPGNNIAINGEMGENNLEMESETIFQPNE